LLKYSARGVRQWVKTYNGAANGNDFGFGVAAGPDGSVYVTGDTDVDGQNSNLLLLKYSARGVRQWVKTYNGAANGYDFGYGVAAGPDGSVYVTGDTYVVGQSYNLLLLKYK
jgi:glucose/arabinose dehydrogenase